MQELLFQLNIKNSFLIITLKMVLLHGSIKLRSSLYGKYYITCIKIYNVCSYVQCYKSKLV